MKIFILIALVLLGQQTEQDYTEQFYIATSYLSYYVRLANEVKDKPAVLKKLDQYLTKVDSTVTELKDFQRKYFLIEDHCLKLYKKHCPPIRYCPLMNCLKLFIIQFVEKFFKEQTTMKDY